MGPEHLKYGPGDVPRELMAEAIRAYMADPNYACPISRFKARHQSLAGALPEVLGMEEAVMLAAKDYLLSEPEKAKLASLLRKSAGVSQQRTAGEAAKPAVRNAAMGLDEVTAGLIKLFGCRSD